MSAESFVRVASTDEVGQGVSRHVEIGGKVVALFNVDGTYYAINGVCTHRGGPLGEGELEEKQVTCPWHGGTFDVTTGEATGPPASGNVACYEVRVNGGDVEVKI